MKNVRKLRNINLSTTKRRRNYLVSEQNYHTAKQISEKLLAKEIIKTTKVMINKPVYLCLSVLAILANSNVSDFVWSRITKISRKSTMMLYIQR